MFLVHKAMGQAPVVSGMDYRVGIAGRILPTGLFSGMPPG
jgi:hypothetical protein